jgi:CNT family concentrative nucleoside transporter
MEDKKLIFQSIAGLIVFAVIAWSMSENRRQIKLKVAVTGIVIQLLVGLILLKLPLFRDFFLLLNRVVLSLEEATTAGTSFVFGYLGGGELPFTEKYPGASFILAFKALPLVLLMSALSALLFYWKILPVVVKGFSWALQRTMGLGGTEGLGVSANIFVGMVESPLFIRPYLENMTRSEIVELGFRSIIAGTLATCMTGAVVGIIGG